MGSTVAVARGGYSFIAGVFQYSAGVAAGPGHEIVRFRFARPVALAAGFARIAATIQDAGRPLTSICACELRSPAPFTDDGFRRFNETYVKTLSEWGVLADGLNPVARSNVCPEIDPPPEPGFHAFSFTRPCAVDAPSFVIAGGGEAAEGMPNYHDHIVAKGDASPAGLRRKALYVLGEMERRMSAFGSGWGDTTAVQLYTVHNIHPFLADELAARGAARNGLLWHFCRPPIVDVDYEMDCRSVAAEHVLPA